ncbi:MAG: TlpA family protein disulfide reductase [Chloroflexi bacterium]|nr:TlpA family protein disulfide reductase [Chloroflexota bacterium]
MNNALILSSILLWIVVLFNLLLTVALIRRGSAAQPGFDMENVETLEIGSQAPDFTAETLDGRTITLNTFSGQNVVFVFVSPDCPPCIEKIPILNSLQQKAKQSGVELVLVNVTNKSKAKKFVEEYETHLPMLVAPENNNSFKERYKAMGTPFYCLVDEQGNVQATGYFGPDWYALTQKWEATFLQSQLAVL